ncbi:2-oxoglutarate malate [Musa troglodytarum]|uniref:2-oxoglutarate malate n=1 Tax=Musa troglodytarum TaxID=320322 RepID=A0A9E7H5P6_9LILI|nr:2-oxoglutarate malate [Musa troglodytarum]
MWTLIHHPLRLLRSPSPSSDRGRLRGVRRRVRGQAPPAMTASVLTCNLGFHSLPSFRCRRRRLLPKSLLPGTPASPFRQSSTLPSFPSAPPKPFPAGLTPTSNHGRRSLIPVVRASAAPAAAPAPWQGAALKPLAASIATGVILWLVPAPSGVSRNAWQLLAIFLATIVGIITQPLPLGAVALMGLGVSVLTKTLTFAAAFSAFGDPIPWLIALAFFFARGFIKTGLGNRVAYQFVSLFGSSSLGLGYSLVFSEALLAPAIPSVSARAGGIFLPLVKALCTACGSNVGDGTENRLGSWLMLTCFQTSVISSSMFLTAMAANPLSANLTQNTINQTIGWIDWAVAAFVPGLVSLSVVPLLLYLIYPPTVKSSPDAPKLAREKLQKMGPMTKNEIIMAGTLLLTVGLWVFGGTLNVDAVTAAILGLSILLITGVVTWKECLSESVAWDTLTWFAALIAMAGYLNKYGLISWFSQTVVKFVGGLGLSWQLSFGILVLLYFYSHYFFASGAAHIGAMFTAFLSVASALGAPPLFAAMVLSFLSNLMGGLTHYGIGSAPVFYGANYVPLPKWWGYGFIISVVNIIIWLGIGGFWWKTIGLW